MTYDEYREYWVPAARSLAAPFPPDLGEGASVSESQDLAKFMGIYYPYAGWWDRINLTPTMCKRLKALAGPHGATIKKMLEIQREST